MKVVQINSVVNRGSTGRIAEELGLAILNKGDRSYIAYGRPSGQSRSEIIKIGGEWDMRLHGIETRLFDRHGLGSRSATKVLVRHLREINPDIIHLHNLHGYYVNIKILFDYLVKSRVPVVWTLHDCWPFTGHCSYFDAYGCNKWIEGCYGCPQKKQYPSSFFADRSKENYRLKKKVFTSPDRMVIVPVSYWLENIVGKSFLNKYPVRVIRNGVDLRLFSPRTETAEIRRRYGIGDRFMLLGVATVWTARKGLSDYVRLAKELPADMRIVLVGLSDIQMRQLPPNIIGIRRTENIDQLAELYSAADVVMNLSLEETFGMTTVEGYACGTPGIVYDRTASPELVTPEIGAIVEAGSIGAVLEAIGKIRRNGKIFYSEQCRAKAVELYNKEEKYSQYLQLYEDMLKGNSI